MTNGVVQAPRTVARRAGAARRGDIRQLLPVLHKPKEAHLGNTDLGVQGVCGVLPDIGPLEGVSGAWQEVGHGHVAVIREGVNVGG